MTITDEMVEIGRRAATGGSQYLREVGEAETRNIIEAIAPMLIVHGMRAALAIMLNAPSPMEGALQIDARAQELDPK